ncbi:hypothetical protein D3C86_2169300 [compost metagenome]
MVTAVPFPVLHQLNVALLHPLDGNSRQGVCRRDARKSRYRRKHDDANLLHFITCPFVTGASFGRGDVNPQ